MFCHKCGRELGNNEICRRCGTLKRREQETVLSSSGVVCVQTDPPLKKLGREKREIESPSSVRLTRGQTQRGMLTLSLVWEDE